LAHVCIKRVPGTVETENQGTAPGTLRVGGLEVGGLSVGVPMVGDLWVGDPFTLVLGKVLANEARVYGRAKETIFGFDRGLSWQRDKGNLGGCIEQRGGRHVGGWGRQAKWEGL
jgi:hypothetical protein